jgi:hypothetical protein
VQINLPDFNFPQNLILPTPVLELPKAEIPSYRPIFVPPKSNLALPRLAAPQPVTQEDVEKAIEEKLEPLLQKLKLPPVSAKVPSAEVIQANIPGTDIQIPLPKAEILSAAATTSVISVGATLAATSLFKRLVSIFKPILKTAAKKIQSRRGKPVQTWARQRLSERHLRKLRSMENLP